MRKNTETYKRPLPPGAQGALTSLGLLCRNTGSFGLGLEVATSLLVSRI